jgi:hypothetical protein
MSFSKYRYINFATYLNTIVYLGANRLRKVDFQSLADRALGSLSGWRGRNLTHDGRLRFGEYILSSQAIYLLTVFNA